MEFTDNLNEGDCAMHYEIEVVDKLRKIKRTFVIMFNQASTSDDAWEFYINRFHNEHLTPINFTYGKYSKRLLNALSMCC